MINYFFQRATFSFKIKQILSISLLSKCTKKTNVQWFDLAVFFRLQNSSLAVALGEKPYETWQEYLLPEWLSQATYVVGEIDIERYTVMFAANVGQVCL